MDAREEIIKENIKRDQDLTNKISERLEKMKKKVADRNYKARRKALKYVNKINNRNLRKFYKQSLKKHNPVVIKFLRFIKTVAHPDKKDLINIKILKKVDIMKRRLKNEVSKILRKYEGDYEDEDGLYFDEDESDNEDPNEYSSDDNPNGYDPSIPKKIKKLDEELAEVLARLVTEDFTDPTSDIIPNKKVFKYFYDSYKELRTPLPLRPVIGPARNIKDIKPKDITFGKDHYLLKSIKKK